jgi:hypothetical protein
MNNFNASLPVSIPRLAPMPRIRRNKAKGKSWGDFEVLLLLSLKPRMAMASTAVARNSEKKQETLVM